RHGLMASVANIRHTVLRLSGVPSAVRARTVTSARDCRRSGCWVSAISAQATALTSAWSTGGESRLAAPSWLVFEGNVAGGPPAAPSLHRTQRPRHVFRGLDVGHERLARPT